MKICKIKAKKLAELYWKLLWKDTDTVQLCGNKKVSFNQQTIRLNTAPVNTWRRPILMSPQFSSRTESWTDELLNWTTLNWTIRTGLWWFISSLVCSSLCMCYSELVLNQSEPAQTTLNSTKNHNRDSQEGTLGAYRLQCSDTGQEIVHGCPSGMNPLQKLQRGQIALFGTVEPVWTSLRRYLNLT